MKEKILKVIDFISYHEDKIVGALVLIIVLTICGIMSLTFVDHTDIIKALVR
jgi:hypothetical protein